MNTIEILKQLIKIKSQSLKEQKIIEYIRKLCQQNNIKHEIQPVFDKNHGNLIAYIGKDFTNPILLTSHIDTVPATDENWDNSPYDAIEKDGRIYGRGSNDNKGAAAAMLSIMLEYSKKEINQGYIFAFTIDEEGNSTGVFKLLEHPLIQKVKFALVGELCFDDMYKDVFETYPSVWMGGFGRSQFELLSDDIKKLSQAVIKIDGREGNKKSLSGTGFYRIRTIEYKSDIQNIDNIETIELKSTPRHGSGRKMENPVVEAAHQINKLIEKNYTIKSVQCFIEGDTYFLSMPNKIIIKYSKINKKTTGCGSIIVDRNTVSDETDNSVLEELKKILPEINIKIKEREMPYLKGWQNNETDILTQKTLHIIEQTFNKKVNKVYKMGPCDANVLSSDGKIPCVVFGPAGGNVHSYNEYTYIESLNKTDQVLRRILNEFL